MEAVMEEPDELQSDQQKVLVESIPPFRGRAATQGGGEQACDNIRKKG